MTTRKFRFKIINACDIVESFEATEIIFPDANGETLILFDAHTFNVGDLISLTGFAPNSVNIITTVIEGDPSSAGIAIQALPGIDLTTLGTVNRLVGERLVDPLNFHKTKFVWSKEGDSIYFRKKLSGKISFGNPNSDTNDWDYFLTNVLPNECCEVKFIIEKNCSGTWVVDWEGYFTHNLGKWDLSHCSVDFEILPDDEYRCINRGASRKHNIAMVPYTGTIKAPYEITFEETTCCQLSTYFAFNGTDGAGCPQRPFALAGGLDWDCGTDPATWQVKRREFYNWNGLEEPFGLIDHCVTWIRETTITVDIGGSPNYPAGEGWVQNAVTTLGGLPAHSWYRLPFNGEFYDDTNYTWTRGDVGQEDPELCDWTLTWDNPTTNDEYTRGHDFAEVLEYIVQNTCGSLAGVRSDFFEINPPGDTPGYVAGTNYVTGDSPNKIANMALFQKSDFINPNAASPATIAPLSFKELMDSLQSIFWVKWFVDADNYLRIEHVSWFTRTAGIDTTTGFNAKLNKGKKVFSYNRDQIPAIEEYSFMEQANLDFVGRPIIYGSACPDDTFTKNHDAPLITTDVAYVQNNPGAIGATGFVLVVRDPADLTVIDQEVGVLSGISKNNAHLSWANLHEAYHRHRRPLIDGNMNGTETTFDSAVPSKLQEDIKYAGDCCNTVDPLEDLVTTELGAGEISKMERDNGSQVLSFELLFD
jgi:hypothetical protein